MFRATWSAVADGNIAAADVPRSDPREIVRGRPIRNPQPGYPQMALAEGAHGTIVVEAHISPAGDVESARVRFGGNRFLEEAAVKAARLWRFSPTTASGTQVAAFAQIVVRFSINAPEPAKRPPN